MSDKPAITSSEIGTLWMTYQEKTVVLRMLEYFIKSSDEEKSKKILTNMYDELSIYTEKILNTFQKKVPSYLSAIHHRM